MPDSRPKLGFDYPSHIRRLMEKLGYGGRGGAARFAEKLKVTPQAVSTFLNGTKEPSGEMYYRMATLKAGLKEATPLLRRAASISHIPGLLEMLGQMQENEKLAPGLNAVQMIDAPDQSQAILPAWLCPDPEQTRLMRVPDNSMRPVLLEGYLAAIDITQTDLSKLEGARVAIRDQRGSALIRYVAKRDNEAPILVPEFPLEDRWYRADECEIIGKVLWWIGKA